jgi:Zn-dependent membrane protease YugP
MEVDLNVVQEKSTEYAEAKKLAIEGIVFFLTKFSRNRIIDHFIMEVTFMLWIGIMMVSGAIVYHSRKLV